MPDLFGNEDPAKEVKPAIPADQYVTNCDPLTDLTYKGKPIRRGRLEDGTEVWVVTDVIAAVTQSKNPQNYWYKTRSRMQAEGNEDVTNCHTLKIKTADGKMRSVEVMTREQILRMLESIPSKKAELCKQWIAHLANERIEEIQNPDLAIQRGYEGYIKKGYSPAFASRRAKSVIHRKALTDQWKSHGISRPKEFAMLTNRESRGIFGKTTSEMKRDRNLPATGNLRDNMSLAELIAQDAGDSVISALIIKNNPYGFEENGVEVDKGSAVGARLLADIQRTLEA